MNHLNCSFCPILLAWCYSYLHFLVYSTKKILCNLEEFSEYWIIIMANIFNSLVNKLIFSKAAANSYWRDWNILHTVSVYGNNNARLHKLITKWLTLEMTNLRYELTFDVISESMSVVQSFSVSIYLYRFRYIYTIHSDYQTKFFI